MRMTTKVTIVAVFWIVGLAVLAALPVRSQQLLANAGADQDGLYLAYANAAQKH